MSGIIESGGEVSFHALRFDRSASRYESEAGIQSRMAARLVELWRGPEPANILEFGCGTGILTRQLQRRFPVAPLLATDAAPRMLEEARNRCVVSEAGSPKFVLQDAQGMASPSADIISISPFDLIASNALVQWFPDLENHLGFAANIVKPKGSCLLSGFTRSNFPELNELLAEPPFSYRDFPGHDSDAVRVAAKNTGWETVVMETWEELEILPSATDVLHRIQALGSTRDPRKGGRLNRKNLNHLTSEYTRRFSEAGGVRLTWQPWIALLTR